MSKRFVISESERNHIKKLYGLLIEQTNTVGCAPFTDKVKNQVIDYQQIIDTYTPLAGQSSVFDYITKLINEGSTQFKSQGIPEKISCELSFIGIRPEFQKDLKLMVTDPQNNLVYFYTTTFDQTTKKQNWNFVAKDPYISGAGQQPTDETLKYLNTLTDDKRQEYLNNNVVTFNGETIKTLDRLNQILKDANAGIYKLGSTTTNKYTTDYSGPENKVINYNYSYQLGDTFGNTTGFATHGIPGKTKKESDPKYGKRWSLLNLARKKLSKSEDPRVNQEDLTYTKN